VPASQILAGCKKSCARFLDGLAPPEIKNVLAEASQRNFASKTVIANQGDPADQLFLLTKGRARLYFTTHEGKKIILVWLAPGQALGGAALLSKPASYLVTTETVEPCSAIVWDRATIRRLAKCYPQILENALLTAGEYLAWYCAAHAALATQSAEQRLAQTMVCLAQVIGREVPDGVELDVINEELASAASITPFTASRLLNQWQRGGVIKKGRGKIVVYSLDGLFPPSA